MNSTNADTLRAIMQIRRPGAGAQEFFSFSFSEFNTEQSEGSLLETVRL